MADMKLTTGALLVGLALGGAGGIALDQGKDMTVSELVAANGDSLTQRIVASELSVNSDTMIIKSMNSEGKVVSERKVTSEHTSIRAEDILKITSIPNRSIFRLVAFVDNTVAAEWSTVSTDSNTCAMAQVLVYRK